MPPAWRSLYWLLTGALLGVGAITILSIGILLLAAGIILLVIGMMRLSGREWPMAVIGFGAAPAAILLWDVTSMPWACNTAGGPTQPGVSYYSCVGPLTTYHVLAIIFGAVALLGLGLLTLTLLLRRRRTILASG